MIVTYLTSLRVRIHYKNKKELQISRHSISLLSISKNLSTRAQNYQYNITVWTYIQHNLEYLCKNCNLTQVILSSFFLRFWNVLKLWLAIINSQGSIKWDLSLYKTCGLGFSIRTSEHTCHFEASTITLSVCPSVWQPAVARPGPDWTPSDLIKSNLMELVRHCTLMDRYTLPLVAPS